MRKLSEFSDEELIETIEHGMDEYPAAPQESVCFTVEACVVLLARISTPEQFAEHVRHIYGYVAETNPNPNPNPEVANASSPRQ